MNFSKGSLQLYSLAYFTQFLKENFVDKVRPNALFEPTETSCSRVWSRAAEESAIAGLSGRRAESLHRLGLLCNNTFCRLRTAAFIPCSFADCVCAEAFPIPSPYIAFGFSKINQLEDILPIETISFSRLLETQTLHRGTTFPVAFRVTSYPFEVLFYIYPNSLLHILVLKYLTFSFISKFLSRYFF